MPLQDELRALGISDYDYQELKERVLAKELYQRFQLAMNKATTVPQMLMAAKIPYGYIEGENTWHENAVKEAFGIEILPELQEFYSLGLTTESDLIFSFEDAMVINHDFRHDTGFTDLYMPFDHVYIFGGNGGGDFYLLTYSKSLRRGLQIFYWDHETDARSVYCWDFTEFLARSGSWYGGYDAFRL